VGAYPRARVAGSLPEREGSWEPIQNLWQFKEQIQAFEDKEAMRTSPE